MSDSKPRIDEPGLVAKVVAGLNAALEINTAYIGATAGRWVAETYSSVADYFENAQLKDDDDFSFMIGNLRSEPVGIVGVACGPNGIATTGLPGRIETTAGNAIFMAASHNGWIDVFSALLLLSAERQSVFKAHNGEPFKQVANMPLAEFVATRYVRVEDFNELADRLTALQVLADKMVARLKRLEWAGSVTSDSGTTWSFCPECGGTPHEKTCELGALLVEIEQFQKETAKHG